MAAKSTSATASPLQWPEGWPRTPASKQESGKQFHRAGVLPTFAKSRDRLAGELSRLKARNVVISSNHPTDPFGKPIEGKRQPADQAVAIFFTLGERELAMACDRFTSSSANMTSLALAIDAMRQLERHGGGHMMEKAFSGFLALPPPIEMKPRRPWRHVLGFAADDPVTKDMASATFRALSKVRHPDKPGGSVDAFNELREALNDALAEIG